MVDVEFDQGLAVLTIDRPHARNAISLDTMDQLEKALDAAEGASALAITGAGDRDRKSTRLNSSHYSRSRMPSSA